ncbi:exodeoxyribonuclease VII large subunit [Candidatus Tisiphia endosymbiont of Ditula angustiorana]|uniref:exodeoxyribonuclease VII large subunit n=1 Tax=Candidatus Tisiphia endosymbiont of Ditula angustiorana TaxID=3066272 RepID=UPI00312C77CA
MLEEDSFITNLVEQEFSVTEISSKIKELLENNFGYIRVKGEISGLKIATSGHGYFNLKENTAILACTCWRPVLTKIKFVPIDGMEVVARGKLSGYAGNSRYQLSVEVLEPAGLGAIMQILKERQERLAQEGIFNKPKKPLPFLPNKIGVVTSMTGAVIKDIIHRINDRCPSHILIWPVTVQGENAASEIASAISGFNELDKDIKPDVIIVARGGGSIEDLWAFNEEVVVRSVFNSAIPIISAVGHEVDNTLIDLVADRRAPTPTAAAEFAVPVLSNLHYTISSYYDALRSRINQLVKYEQQAVNSNTDIFRSITTYIDYNQQLLDELSFRLTDSLPNLLRFKVAKLDSLNIEILNPLKIVNYQSLELVHQSNYMLKSISTKLKNYEHQLNLNNLLLTSLDYKTVLKRGFAVIKSEDGEFITSKVVASKKQEFNIKFFDGDINVCCKNLE